MRSFILQGVQYVNAPSFVPEHSNLNFLRVNTPSVLFRFMILMEFHHPRGHLLKYEQFLWSNIIEILQIGGTMGLYVDFPIGCTLS